MSTKEGRITFRCITNMEHPVEKALNSGRLQEKEKYQFEIVDKFKKPTRLTVHVILRALTHLMTDITDGQPDIETPEDC